MNSAAIDVHVHFMGESIFPVLLGLYPGVELMLHGVILELYGNSMFNFLRKSQTFPKWLQHFVINVL